MENVTDSNNQEQHSRQTITESSKCYDFEEEIQALYMSIPEVENHFTITNKIGEGSFSSVYLARLKHHPEVNEMFALKHIIPTTHPSRIENELRCLLNIGGQDNVMGVKLCLRNRDNVVIVMPIFPHEKFQEYLHQMDPDETREYMKNLLTALRRVHKFRVIHRDIKPSNFLYNRQQKQYALVDFGLATGAFLIDRESENIGRSVSSAKSKVSATNSAPSLNADARIPLSPSKREADVNLVNAEKPKRGGGARNKKVASTNLTSTSSKRLGMCSCFGKPRVCSLCISRSNQVAPRAGTAGFRSPEVLMKSPSQDTAIDIWAAGVIFLSILSARYPFFRAEDDMGHLAQIISLLGSEVCIKAAMDFGKVLTLSENLPPVDLKSACIKLRLSQMSYRLVPSSQGNRTIQSWADISDEPFDLLYKMLDPNPKTRISAEEALRHPYFRDCDSEKS